MVDGGLTLLFLLASSADGEIASFNPALSQIVLGGGTWYLYRLMITDYLNLPPPSTGDALIDTPTDEDESFAE